LVIFFKESDFSESFSCLPLLVYRLPGPPFSLWVRWSSLLP